MVDRLMTRETLSFLRKTKAGLERFIREAGGGSGHQRASVHDDAATEHMLDDARSRLARIGDLGGVSIIQPREKTDSVDLGNRVRVQYDGEEEPETIHLLSRDDRVYRNDLGAIASTDSPLGRALRGRGAGDEVEVSVNPKSSFRVRVLEIFPGDF